MEKLSLLKYVFLREILNVRVPFDMVETYFLGRAKGEIGSRATSRFERFPTVHTRFSTFRCSQIYHKCVHELPAFNKIEFEFIVSEI